MDPSPEPGLPEAMSLKIQKIGVNSEISTDEYEGDFSEARSHSESISPRSAAAFSPQPENREFAREIAVLKAENERLRGDTIRLRADEKRALDLCDEAKAKWVSALTREDDLQKSLDKARADLISLQTTMASITVELDSAKAREKRSASAISVLEEAIAATKVESNDVIAQAEAVFLTKVSALETKNEAAVAVVKTEAAEKLSIARSEAQQALDELRKEADAALTAARAAHAKELSFQQADAAEKIKKAQEEANAKVQAVEAAAKSLAESAAARLLATQEDAERAAVSAAARLAASESSSRANLEAMQSEAASKLSYSESLARVAASEAAALISARDSTISLLRDEIAVERDQRNKLNTEFTSTRESLTISQSNLATAKETTRLIEAARDTLVSNQELEIARLRKGLDEEISKLAEQKKSHEQSRAEMVAELNAVRLEHEATKVKLAVEHEATKKAIHDEHEKSVLSLLTDHDSSKQSLVSEHEDTKRSLQSEIDSLSNALHTANTTVANRESHISDLQASLKKYEDMYAAEVIEKTATKSALSSVEAAVLDLNRSLQDLGSRHSIACTQIENLTSDLDRTRSKCAELSSFLSLAKITSEGARGAVLELQEIESTEANFESTTLLNVRPADTLEESNLRKEEAVVKYQEEVALHAGLVDSAVVSLAQIVSLLNNDLDGVKSSNSVEASDEMGSAPLSKSTEAVDSLTAIAVISRLLHKTVTDAARERAIRYARAGEVSNLSIVDALRERRRMLLKIRSRVFESVMKSATVRSDTSPSISAVRMAENVSEALFEFIAVMDKAVKDMGVLLPQHDLEEIELGIGIQQSESSGGGGGGSLFSPQPPPVPSYSPPSTKRSESSPLSTRSVLASSLLLPETPLGAVTSSRSLARSRASRASSVTLASPRRFCGAANCMREHKQGITEQTYASVRTFAKKTISATATEKLLHSSASGYSPASWSARLTSQTK